MQVEQKTSHLKKKPQVLPVSPPPAEQQREREWGRTGMFNAPAPVVRDIRSLVKNTRSLSLPMATTTPLNIRPTSFNVTGQVGSPPSTYQQALGVKGHTTASLSNSHDRKQSDTSGCPITQQRRGSEPITSRLKVDDGLLVDLLTNAPVSQSEKAAGVSHLFSLPKPTTSRLPQGAQALHSAQEQNSILNVSSHCSPSSSQVLHPCFYNPPTLHPYLGKVSYVHNPLSSIQTQVQSAQPAPTLHLHTKSENRNRSTGKSSDQIIKTCPPQGIETTEEQEGRGGKMTATTKQQQQQSQQLPFLCGVQSAQVCGSLLTSSHGAIFTGTAPYHVTTDPKSRLCVYGDMPPQLQSKMLLDLETGQFIQVFLPADSSSLCGANPTTTVINPSPSVVHMASANTAPAVLQVGGANPPVMSVMQFQPTAAVSSLYAPLHLPFTLHMPTVYTAP